VTIAPASLCSTGKANNVSRKQRSAAAATRLAALCFVTSAGCAGTPETAETAVSDVAVAREAVAIDPAGLAELEEMAEPTEPLLDVTRDRVFNLVNSSSHWFDGFFGSSELNDDPREDVSRGLLAVGTRYDERDEFETRGRLRAQIPLPALKQRTRLLLGRGDTEDVVDGSETETINTLPEQFSDFTDDDWLLGLGYREKTGLRGGFDFGVGASFSSATVDPYARITYRYNVTVGDNLLWRIRPRVFWQEKRGEGMSVNSILDYVLGSSWLLRSWITLLAEDEVEGMGWKTDFLAYKTINDENAVSLRAFTTGETGAEVAVRDYGIELRYRRRFLREWLFLEVSTGVSWPREFLIEERERNYGVGVELEMQFGDWPGREHEVEPTPE